MQHSPLHQISRASVHRRNWNFAATLVVLTCLLGSLALPIAAAPGDGVWTNLFNGLGAVTDIANAIAVDGSGNVFVTGESDSLSTGIDFATVKYSASGIPLWTNYYNGPGDGDDQPAGIAVDGNGNVFVTGLSAGLGSVDFATVAYSGAGVPLWTNRYDGPGADYDKAKAIKVDGNGNVFVTGQSYGLGSPDYATIAYSGAGVPLWTNRYDGPANSLENPNAMAVDGSGNVFVTGLSISGPGFFDYATVAYSGAGVPLWTNRYDGPSQNFDVATAVAVDADGNVFVTGLVTVSVGGPFDFATVAYSGAGVPLWTNLYNGPGNSMDQATGVAVDGTGNVFVTGISSGSGTGNDYATIKYSGAGVPLWTNRYDGPASGLDAPSSIVVDGSGNVIVTGYSDGTGTADDVATVAYSNSGAPLWTSRYNGAGNNSDRANAIAIDANGNVFVTGYATDNVTFKDFVTIKYASSDSGNVAPTSFSLDNVTVLEQQSIGTRVGTLTTADANLPTDSHTYSLVNGTNCNDNEYFQIVGDQLQTRSNLLYSARSIYIVFIRTTDLGGLFYERPVYISVLPLPGASPAPSYANDFSVGVSGWNRFPGLELAPDGNGHGLVAPGTPAAPTAAATDFGAYGTGSATGSGFTTSLDIYLDTNTADGLKFGYAVVLNNLAHVATNEATYLVARTNLPGALGFRINAVSGLPGAFENPDGSADAPADDANDIVITNSGWYTFQHWFHPDGHTNLVAELQILDVSSNLVGSWAFTNALKVGVDVSESRYGKIFGNEFASLLVDNSRLTTIPRPVALATGMVVDEDESQPVLLLSHSFPSTQVPAIVARQQKITTGPLHGSLDHSTGVYFPEPVVVYTPAPDYFGADSFKFLVNNGAQDSAVVTVSITVTPVNDAPSFALSVNGVTVAEDSAQTTLTIVNPASVSKGPANESGQLISYLVDSGYNTALFMTQPTVSSIGSLTFRPAANASGNTTIYVRAMDNGGTACGGHDTSGALPFLISITPSNDAPVLAVIANVTVNEGLTSTPTVDVPLAITDIETPLANMIVSVVLSNQTGGIVLPGTPTTGISGGQWHVYLPVVAEQSGQVNVHVKATDTGDGPSPARSASRMFVFKVTAVNDAPGFVIPTSVHSAPNVAVTTVGFSTFYANGATPSDTSENAQTGSYTLTVQTADRAKFATQPTITSAGTLTYKFAAGASGSCVVQVKVTDNGGTAGGGVNVSPTQNLTFNVDP